VAKEPDHRGEHEVNVKTIAQGSSGISGEPVVTTLVCFSHFAREAMGAAGTRLSLRPCVQEICQNVRTGGWMKTARCWN
jgi:hypothetical protein